MNKFEMLRKALLFAIICIGTYGMWVEDYNTLLTAMFIVQLEILTNGKGK